MTANKPSVVQSKVKRRLARQQVEAAELRT